MSRSDSAQFRVTYPNGQVIYATARLPVTIGRQLGNSIQVLDPDVSKYHVRIESDAGQYVIQDQDSANGTSVNQQRVKVGTLERGDQIGLGGTVTVDVLQLPRLQVPQFVGETIILSELPQKVTYELKESGRGRDVYKRISKHLEELTNQSQHVRTIDAFGDLLLGRLDELLPFERASLFLASKHGRPECVASRGKISVPAVFPDTLRERVDLRLRGLITQDHLQDSIVESRVSRIDEGIRSSIVVPIALGTQVLAYLYVSSIMDSHRYTDAELDILQRMANGLALLLENIQLRQRIRDEMRLEAELARFLPPALVASLTESSSGQEREALAQQLDALQKTRKITSTVMFVDIRGFTQIASKFPADDVMAGLNAYYEEVVEIIFRAGGGIDKFMGDGLMAVWGLAEGDDVGAEQAVNAAHEIQQLVRTREPPFFEGLTKRISIGIGIATGNVISAVVGGASRKDHTVIGHTVNVASRLCDAASADEILLASTTGKLLPNGCRLRPKGEIEMKGLKSILRVYALDDIQRGGQDT